MVDQVKFEGNEIDSLLASQSGAFSEGIGSKFIGDDLGDLDDVISIFDKHNVFAGKASQTLSVLTTKTINAPEMFEFVGGVRGAAGLGVDAGKGLKQ